MMTMRRRGVMARLARLGRRFAACALTVGALHAAAAEPVDLKFAAFPPPPGALVQDVLRPG